MNYICVDIKINSRIMPKLIDYPRTNYTGAWELAEITDDTGGKCTIETAARKLNRKVSGSFKAIIGSAVKFGLITSKRELLTTTTLFKRIKHAYDKQEELTFHREAFLTPPLFTQICRKFRSRELPVQMLDVMLIREFGVEEINAQGVAKAFVDGCRMVNLLDEYNIIADIDAFSTKQRANQQLSNPVPQVNAFRIEELPMEMVRPENLLQKLSFTKSNPPEITSEIISGSLQFITKNLVSVATDTADRGDDTIANLFGFNDNKVPTLESQEKENRTATPVTDSTILQNSPIINNRSETKPMIEKLVPLKINSDNSYQIRISGPGVNTELTITEEEDIVLAIALLEKIRRQLKG